MRRCGDNASGHALHGCGCSVEPAQSRTRLCLAILSNNHQACLARMSALHSPPRPRLPPPPPSSPQLLTAQMPRALCQPCTALTPSRPLLQLIPRPQPPMQPAARPPASQPPSHGSSRASLALSLPADARLRLCGLSPNIGRSLAATATPLLLLPLLLALCLFVPVLFVPAGAWCLVPAAPATRRQPADPPANQSRVCSPSQHSLTTPTTPLTTLTTHHSPRLAAWPCSFPPTSRCMRPASRPRILHPSMRLLQMFHAPVRGGSSPPSMHSICAPGH